MAWRLPLVLVAALALAGCLGGGPSVLPAGSPADLALPEVAWKTPQLASHPAFGWPTSIDARLPSGIVPSWWQPIAARALPEQVTKLERVAGPEQAHGGAGIAVFGSLLAVSGRGTDSGFWLYDIRDPEAPKLLSNPEGTPGRDADFIAYPDGRLVLVMASDYGVDPVWDVTDPTAPVLLTEIDPGPRGSHNLVVVPGTPIFYNSNSNGGGGAPFVGALQPDMATQGTEIYDLTDPANPVLVQDWRNGYGCHDTTVWIDAASQKFRAYCAGVDAVQIWDIADPRAPVVLTTLNMPLLQDGVPSLTSVPFSPWAHSAEVNHDGTVLMVGDETGGGGAPGCDVYIDAAGRTLSGPIGNLYFFDLADELKPQLRSWLSPDSTLLTNVATNEPLNCTSHFGREIEDRNQVVWGFYGQGVLLIDFSDLDHPVILDQYKDASDTWDAWSWQGYVFTGDIARGFDVLEPQ
ncbi:MAG TPA: hypothetical protein VGR28_08310 [Candidatus Thermoplasmatota archaeon]|jgi:hypothetical protein|nr:hypothetical protein [Candidatus Thermoplasmatota archaeon]